MPEEQARPIPPTAREAPAAAIVIFGASGDLTSRKLIPALFRLWCQKLLPPGTCIVGVARTQDTDEKFREDLWTAMQEDSPDTARDHKEHYDEFAKGIFYHTGTFEDRTVFDALGAKLRQLDAERGTGGNRLFYLATPPAAFPLIVRSLGAARLVNRSHDGPWTRIIVEKPFGHDLAGAQSLNAIVGDSFREDQIFRIDHYLGKETVQNILVLRLGNGIFEPLWNCRYVDHVQITVGESLGVEGRAGYFEQAGVIRDMVQNHMLQLLTLTAMEPPVEFSADAVRNEKVKVLQSVRIPDPEEVARTVVRGQYGPGTIDGSAVPGYRQEPGVAPASSTETFVAARLSVDNWRWAGVPFYLRSGKRLPKRETEIAIAFKAAPYSVFRRSMPGTLGPNILALRIQPDEGISLSFGAKVPGQIRIEPVQMDFLYSEAFGGRPPEAYERLLLDAMHGDSTLFARRDEVEGAWKIVDAIIAGWQAAGAAPIPEYAAGSWNPKEADELLARDGRAWRKL
jgi:glucose-6-phosphate 1-dehydrogenase